MNKKEFKALRGRYRRACRDTWRSAEELTRGLLYIPDDAMECYNRCGELMKEFAAVVGCEYPSRVLSNILNWESWQEV